MERTVELIVAACKEAGLHPEGIALYKVGKHAGLFSSKTGPAGEAALQAVEAGYLELLRTESKAETVRLTARGEAYLQQHLDPKATLEELLHELKTHQQHLPRWMAEIEAQFAAFRLRSLNFLEQQGAALTKLLSRTEAALRRLESGAMPALTQSLEPWQIETLLTLDKQPDKQRNPLSLSDLFHTLERAGFRSLTIADFHDGLLILRDRGSLLLQPQDAAAGPMLEPEYALLEEGTIYIGVMSKP